MAAAQPFTLALQAGGLPDARFAYLDSAIDPFTMRAIEGGALFLLGILPALFDDNYVALMPGLQWLPTPGANAGQDHPDARPGLLRGRSGSGSASRLASGGGPASDNR